VQQHLGHITAPARTRLGHRIGWGGGHNRQYTRMTHTMTQ
jgi:hypothetical protein